jgi:hypothetical protein
MNAEYSIALSLTRKMLSKVPVVIWNWLRKERQSQKTNSDVVKRLDIFFFSFPKDGSQKIQIKYMAHEI